MQRFALHDAQLVLARAYGFGSWPKLEAYVDGVTVQRLADAVTALETIRLDLLRLTAGAGSVEGLTADLAEARAVSEEVGRLLAARDEVAAQLG